MSPQEDIRAALSARCSILGFFDVAIPLEHPEVLAHGDYATSLALLLSKRAGKSPRAMAEEIVAGLVLPASVSSVSIAGPGFINFTLAQNFFATSLSTILGAPLTWGNGTSRVGTELVVEYTDPNPFKVFHIGHLMSNAIGESLSRLTKSQGAIVHNANYQGDVGIHIACAIWGMRELGIQTKDAKEFGKAYALGATALKENPEAKEAITAINKKLYDRTDPEINTAYDEGRRASLELFETIYALLGTTFENYFFESEVAQPGKEVVLAHPDVYEKSDGATVFKGEAFGLHTRVFLNAQGLPTYETKEIGLAYTKQALYPNAQTFVVVTANEITEYYKVVKKSIEQFDAPLSQKMLHVPHGMMKLSSGKMSSRTGNVITGESLIGDLVIAAKARAEESRADNPHVLAEEIAVAAIKFQVLRQGTGKDIVFDESKALSLEGDTGPYIQYAHARCCSLLMKGAELGCTPKPNAEIVPSDLERTLYYFPEVVERSATELEPHHVAHYAVHVASLFNSWYANTQVLDGGTDVPHKLAVVQATQITLKNALNLLGIRAPEKM
ncbi:MAG: arginine--tRNA ligase [Minisyncoccia bacterium]